MLEKSAAQNRSPPRFPKGKEFGFPSPGNVQVCNLQASEPFLTSLLCHRLQLFRIFFNRSHRAASLKHATTSKITTASAGTSGRKRDIGGGCRETETERGRGTRTTLGQKAPRFTASWDTTPFYLMGLGFLLLQSKVHLSKQPG